MPPRPIRRTMEIFGVLRHHEVRALWLADWISDVGNFITFIALAIYIKRLTGTATAVGLVLALRSVPWFTLGPFAGALADRVDRRSMVIWANLIRAGLVAALPFTNAAWQAYALALASSAFGPIHRPARSALLAQVAPEGKLVPALAVHETTHQVLHTIGPAIGGLVVFLIGPRPAFFLDAASFVVAAALQARIRSRGRPASVGRARPLRDVREGFTAVLRTSAVRAYVSLNAAIALGFAGVIALLLFYVRDVLARPEGWYGIVLSAAGVGTVITSLVVAARDEHHARTLWAVASVGGIAAFALVGLHPDLPLLLVIALGAGLADAGAGLPMSATIAEAMPDDVRGRVYGAELAIYELATAIGSLAFAWLGEPERLGVSAGITLAAVSGAALAVVALVAGGAAAIAAHERRRLAAIEAGR